MKTAKASRSLKRVTVITHDGRITTRVYKPMLNDLQREVGGFIELLPGWTKYEGRRCEVYVNEDGKRLDLPLNVKATDLWYEAIPNFSKSYSREQIDTLRGNVVIVGGDA